MDKKQMLALAAKTFVDIARKTETVLIFDDGTVFLGDSAGTSNANNYAKDKKVKYQTIAKKDAAAQIKEYEAQKKADAEKIENEKKARFAAQQALINEEKDKVIVRQKAYEAALLDKEAK